MESEHVSELHTFTSDVNAGELGSRTPSPRYRAKRGQFGGCPVPFMPELGPLRTPKGVGWGWEALQRWVSRLQNSGSGVQPGQRACPPTPPAGYSLDDCRVLKRPLAVLARLATCDQICHALSKQLAFCFTGAGLGSR